MQQSGPYVHRSVGYCLFHYGKRTLIVEITTGFSRARFLSAFCPGQPSSRNKKRAQSCVHVLDIPCWTGSQFYALQNNIVAETAAR